MSTKLYVGNLSYNTNDDVLRTHFETVGAVRDIAVITDRETGRPRGFGFVTMETADDAQRAISELDGRELDGRSLKVNEARERSGGGNRRF